MDVIKPTGWAEGFNPLSPMYLHTEGNKVAGAWDTPESWGELRGTLNAGGESAVFGFANETTTSSKGNITFHLAQNGNWFTGYWSGKIPRGIIPKDSALAWNGTLVNCDHLDHRDFLKEKSENTQLK